jgi:hypothetical protein
MGCNIIDKVFKSSSTITIINVSDAHHGNIIDKEELLLSEITKL